MSRYNLIFLVCFFLNCPNTALAQAQSGPKKPRPKLLRLYGVDFAIWQEKIPVKNVVGEFPVQMQSMGFIAHMNFLKNPARSHWRAFQTWDFGFGKIQGAGSTSELPDKLDNQMWLLAGGSYGYNYRTSSITDIGISVPVYGRYINWRLQSGTSTDPARDFSFSIGLKGHYLARLRKNLFMEASVSHQFLWESTIWMVGLQFLP